MKTPPRTYLATPYAHPDPTVMDKRFEVVNHVTAELMLDGVHVYSPISHNHPLAVLGCMPRGWDFWGPFDLAVLATCQRLLVLQLPGWEQSTGVTAEIAFAAEHGIPVEYMPAPKWSRPVRRDGVTMLTLSAYAIVYLQETRDLTLKEAAELMNAANVPAYLALKDALRDEMRARLAKDLERFDPPDPLAESDPIREAVSKLPPEERDRLAADALAAIQRRRP